MNAAISERARSNDFDRGFVSVERRHEGSLKLQKMPCTKGAGFLCRVEKVGRSVSVLRPPVLLSPIAGGREASPVLRPIDRGCNTGGSNGAQRAAPSGTWAPSERGRQLRRPYFRTTRRPCSRMSALYRSIWPASPAQLRARFFRAWASASLCANFTKRRHSVD